jgi:hypothetical protein
VKVSFLLSLRSFCSGLQSLVQINRVSKNIKRRCPFDIKCNANIKIQARTSPIYTNVEIDNSRATVRATGMNRMAQCVDLRLVSASATLFMQQSNKLPAHLNPQRLSSHPKGVFNMPPKKVVRATCTMQYKELSWKKGDFFYVNQFN